MKWKSSRTKICLVSAVLFVVTLFPVTLSAQLSLLDKKESTTCVDREFTVVAHMLRDTFQNVAGDPDNVISGLELVNRWFDPICVRFNLVLVDTIDNFQYDVPESQAEVEQIWTNHNARNRINLYVVGDLAFVSDEPVLATQEGILETETGGILIQNGTLESLPRWLIHGFGHYCGLLNTNTDLGIESVNGDNCETEGDQICDTPSDPHDPSVPFMGLGIYYDADCRFIWEVLDANGDYYVPDTGNAMSRYPTGCWCGLTFEQFETMADLLSRTEMW